MNAHLFQLMTKAGFAVVGTGGNCTAWSCDVGGHQLLVTDGEASHHISRRDGVCVSLYSGENGDEIAIASHVPVELLIKVAS